MSIETDIDAFLRKLDIDISKVLLTNVTETAKDALYREIYDEVYAKYEPKKYVRKYDLGGLSDKETNMMATVDVATRTLEVEDVREDEGTGADVAAKVEQGYWFPNRQFFMPPRPFHKPAEERLIATGDADKALENGLHDLGY